MIQSSAQVTRSSKGWDDPPSEDINIDTSYVSEYPESFEESVASESHGSPQFKSKQESAQPIQSVKTIDDLLSDDDDDDDEKPETSPNRDHENEFDEVRSSRAESIDTVSRQKPSYISSREAFSHNEPSKKSDLLSPVDGDDDIYGQLDESIHHDDPSHSAILDESGEHVNDDQNDLSQSRRSNQEDEDDYRQLTQSSAIKKSLFNAPPQTASNPNNRSKRSEEDEDEYFDDDFEDTDDDDHGDESKNQKNDEGKHEDEGSYVESLEEEIEEIEEDENDFSYGGASSGDEDMLNRKDQSESKNSQSSLFRTTGSTRTAKPETTVPGRKNQANSALKYDHNSSDDDDLYLPTTKRTSEPEKRTLAKTDENSDDEDMYTPTASARTTAPKSLFGQNKPQPKYDAESDHDDVPETGSASDFSAGHSDDDSFLHESIEHKGRNESTEFSMSEHEISGSHVLDAGFDYTTNALPPSRKFGGR